MTTFERDHEITVSAFSLTNEAADAMFDRVANAAHALDEEVTCTGGATKTVRPRGIRRLLPPILFERRDARRELLGSLTDFREQLVLSNESLLESRDKLAQLNEDLGDQLVRLDVLAVGINHDASPCSRCGTRSVGESSGRGGETAAVAPATEGGAR